MISVYWLSNNRVLYSKICKQSARNRTTKLLQVYAGSVKDLISQKCKSATTCIWQTTRLALVVLPCAVLHRADESQPARNSCPRLPHSVDSRFGLYHVAVVLSFLRSPISLAEISVKFGPLRKEEERAFITDIELTIIK